MSFPSMHHATRTRGPRPWRSRLFQVLEGAAGAVLAPFIVGFVLALALLLVYASVKVEIVGGSRFVVGGMLLCGALAFLPSYLVGHEARPTEPPAEPMPAYVDARTATLVARMLRLRAKRRALSVAAADRSRVYVLLGGSSLILVSASIGYAIVHLTSLGETAAAVCSGGALLTTSVIAARLAPSRRRHALRELLDHTARRLGGRPCFDPARRVAWVDRHWLGDLTASDLYASAGGGTITLVAHGYPVLVMLDPLPVHVALEPSRAKQRRPPRIEVFLAALVSGEGRHASAHVAQASHWLASQGFELVMSEVGLRARATVPRLDTLRHDQTTLTEIDQAVHALVCLAASLGAEPVAPIP